MATWLIWFGRTPGSPGSPGIHQIQPCTSVHEILYLWIPMACATSSISSFVQSFISLFHCMTISPDQKKIERRAGSETEIWSRSLNTVRTNPGELHWSCYVLHGLYLGSNQNALGTLGPQDLVLTVKIGSRGVEAWEIAQPNYQPFGIMWHEIAICNVLLRFTIFSPMFVQKNRFDLSTFHIFHSKLLSYVSICLVFGHRG